LFGHQRQNKKVHPPPLDGRAPNAVYKKCLYSHGLPKEKRPLTVV
jgi:hypothetical protein